MTSIREALLHATETLRASSPTPDIDAVYLLSEVLTTNSAWLLLHAEMMLSVDAEAKFNTWVSRRQQGIPVAYLTESRGFWTLDLYVNEEVLIPRPETELLVELALKYLDRDQVCNIADLGTGSGAIALSLAAECPQWHIDAIDISEAALAVAQRNAENYKLNQVNFYQGSWCQALPRHDYDALISNPPYLAEHDAHLQGTDLSYEPKTALVAGPTGLEAYASIIGNANNHLKPNGLLLLEHGYNQREALAQLLNQKGFKIIAEADDYQNLPRVLIARS